MSGTVMWLTHIFMFRQQNKYISQFGRAHFAIKTNIFWTNTKATQKGMATAMLLAHIFMFRQMHLAIQTNTFCNSDKYILKFGQIHFRQTYIKAAQRRPATVMWLTHIFVFKSNQAGILSKYSKWQNVHCTVFPLFVICMFHLTNMIPTRGNRGTCK